MKKALALLLALCLCFTLGMALVSCDEEAPEHTHTFKTDWSKDATNHWHVCEGEGCTEVSEKAEHTFGEATKVKNGVYNYACTGCDHVKTETMETKLTAEQFANLTLGENFIVTLNATGYQDNTAVATVTWIEMRDGNKFSTERVTSSLNNDLKDEYNVFFVAEEDQVYRYDVEYDDNGVLTSCTKLGIGLTLAHKAELVEGTFLFDEFKNASAFTYDEETNTYIAATIRAESNQITCTNVKAAFENGKIVSLSFTYTVDDESTVIYEYEFAFAYGTASITVPDPIPVA